ncbi:hypothetical protein ACB092_05G203400 [Castanea dentata]
MKKKWGKYFGSSLRYEDVFISRVMLKKDSTKPYWKERFIDGLPPIFAHKVKNELIGKNDSIVFDTLTYGDIFSTIKKFGINMCNDEKWQKRKSKHDKVYKSYSHKKHRRYRTHFVKPNNFYAKNKSAFRKHDKQKLGKGKCFNYGKFGHFIKDYNQKPGKLKNKLNMLNINNNDQNELFQILESVASTNSFEENFSSSSDSDYHSCSDVSKSPNIKLGCRDSCCNVIKSVKMLTTSKENDDLLLTMINYLDKFMKNLTKDEKVKRPKSMISFEETLKRLNKNKSKEITVNDLQHDIKTVKQEIIQLKNDVKTIKQDNDHLKQELLILKIDKNMDKHQSDDDEQKDGDESDQQAFPSGNVSDHVLINLIDNELSLVNHMLPKWYTKVKIVVDHDYAFNVVAMIDSGVDVNCIQEGLIPSKYFEKYTERLVSANGTKMKVKYELNNAHVCHYNVCFKIPSVLVENMTDKVILGLPFINSLYPFLTKDDGITTDHFGQKVKFKFCSKHETRNDFNLIHAKVKHLNFLQQEVRYKKIVEQLSDKLLQSKIVNFQKILMSDHRKKHIVNLPYATDFSEKNIPTKARPIQMNAKTFEFCKNEINDLLKKKLIRNNKVAIKSPLHIAKGYFPPLFHWIPEHGGKKLEFYSDILCQEDAIVIKTIFDLHDKSKIIYHSVYLKNVATKASWGHSPASTKRLPKHSVPYSYHDFIDAWFRFMLHQNETMTHSWFINFDKECDNNADLPLWFIQWWNQFGPDIDIFPKPLVDCFNFWKQSFKVNAHNAKFPALLHFVKRFRIPWILKWQYEKEGDILTRHWYVKWWDKFGYISQILDNVYRRPPPKHLIPSAQSTSKAPSTSQASNIDNLSKDDLYALLKKKIEEEKETENRNSEEEGSVAESPYYP